MENWSICTYLHCLSSQFMTESENTTCAGQLIMLFLINTLGDFLLQPLVVKSDNTALTMPTLCSPWFLPTVWQHFSLFLLLKTTRNVRKKDMLHASPFMLSHESHSLICFPGISQLYCRKANLVSIKEHVFKINEWIIK